jgi:hypothetical protein
MMLLVLSRSSVSPRSSAKKHKEDQAEAEEQRALTAVSANQWTCFVAAMPLPSLAARRLARIRHDHLVRCYACNLRWQHISCNLQEFVKELLAQVMRFDHLMQVARMDALALL